MENFRYPLIALLAFFMSFVALPVSAQNDGNAVSLREILRRHNRALGQVDVYRKLNSYVAEGQIEQAGVVAEFTLYKREGKMRLEVGTQGKPTVIVYDGQDAWEWELDSSVVEVTKLNSLQTEWLKKEARFDDLLLVADELGYNAEFMGLVRLGESGLRVYQIRLSNPNTEEEIDVFLNQISYLEVQRNYRPAHGFPVLETSFSDYRLIDGVRVPFRVVNRIEGELLSTVTLSGVEINTGILGIYFQYPAGRTVVFEPESQAPSPAK